MRNRCRRELTIESQTSVAASPESNLTIKQRKFRYQNDGVSHDMRQSQRNNNEFFDRTERYN